MNISTNLLLTLSLCVAGLPIAKMANAQEDRPLEVVVFPGGFNWPIFVAQKQELFAAEGISVNITPTPDSKTQMVGLIDGKFDIAMTAIDNVIAYSEGQGAAPTQKIPDIFAFMGSDSGFLSVVAVPEVKTYSDLKGKKIGVDALTTGYAFALRKMLIDKGIEPSDIEFVQAGGVSKRFEALMKKEIAATLLVSPFEAAASQQGFTVLGATSTSLGAYQGVVAAARRDWTKANEGKVKQYVRAYRQALNWLYDPNNKQAAIGILRKNLPDMSEPLAQTTYNVLLDSSSGFFKDAAIDRAGVAKVLELRSEFAEPKKQLGGPEKYYDMSYYQAASK
ncbi:MULTISPECIES: ABC transporter substrate-binding protein [Rhizobium/Agrobacterium group]|uniref:ABC transporter substrate-binding protein n=1 Tax=Rhizobium/Agrobacterium group TaxID=227290 RepID=UPI001ADA6F1E|nr:MULTISPECIES: ABC transporter substrate-binding protein [Rhizobium/Agrobacterium group]MBO9112583.1 ABC transporter substrate-binding protein [Agrobacterium sp. S2/73]QXZ76085.1 ABC transporter substrate-binding protein [Agrobacterium sp. S7/73]QYA16909.1 ABC transporter substrate-binding protein [Rhizobium sp. AB2/73]UEQ85519.1 ABC transporter substrate-binding protein [Rhizobium sp. AB2/73]